MRLSLYAKILETSWVQSLAWRSDVFFYRLWDFFVPLSNIIIWSAVFTQTDTLNGYTKSTMLSYVLLSSFFGILSRNWVAMTVSRDIREGALNQYLVKPMSYISYRFVAGLGSTALATGAALCVTAVLVVAYKDVLYFPTFLQAGMAFLVSFIAVILSFQLSILVGLMAFWLTSIDGFTDSYIAVRDFFSGAWFPLDLLGGAFFTCASVLPFAYTTYIPTQIFLGRMSVSQSLRAVCIESLWIIVLYFVTQLVWRRGIRRYEAVGI